MCRSELGVGWEKPALKVDDITGQAGSPVEQKAEETGKLSGAGFTLVFLIFFKIYFLYMGVLLI